jgi:hypothetical protein
MKEKFQVVGVVSLILFLLIGTLWINRLLIQWQVRGCVNDSGDRYVEKWGEACKEDSMYSDCKLPAAIADDLEATLQYQQGLCINIYK